MHWRSKQQLSGDKVIRRKRKGRGLFNQISTNYFSSANHTLESNYVLTDYYHISQTRNTGNGLNLSTYRTLMKKICKKINLYEPTLKNSLKLEKYIRKKS